ncbi:hypothetical protein [Piscirickettsia litoralis]|uniref:Uncharacterized protein n=1 Tax=Piscirickettsia litoralis TaxID=1891921 RepID=A0ABX3A3B8_9GAMM|nr:hypothetical protein [Piscirickettsia litoralis]ODN43005.1 hypothetical protein BGC07_08845 [Piscirickettsia litoralis]
MLNPEDVRKRAQSEPQKYNLSDVESGSKTRLYTIDIPLKDELSDGSPILAPHRHDFGVGDHVKIAACFQANLGNDKKKRAQSLTDLRQPLASHSGKYGYGYGTATALKLTSAT